MRSPLPARIALAIPFNLFAIRAYIDCIECGSEQAHVADTIYTYQRMSLASLHNTVRALLRLNARHRRFARKMRWSLLDKIQKLLKIS
ncbi:hypothetical protein [Roseixanthobacter liquoris]|uniref:hypothetical protein n=1 Tax=Roseixanthobacter liquoris TaxID=3119921 RepID=UPI003726F90D